MHVVEALSQRSAEVGEETGDGRTAGGGEGGESGGRGVSGFCIPGHMSISESCLSIRLNNQRSHSV